MYIRKFYDELIITKKKPELIIGKTQSPIAEYYPFTRRIIINEKISKEITDDDIKFMLCHELGHYLNLRVVFLYKLFGLSLMMLSILILGFGLMIWTTYGLICGFLFYLFTFLLGFYLMGLADDYNEYVADKYSLHQNKMSAEDFKYMMIRLIGKYSHKKSAKKRNLRRMNRTYNWIKKGL